jgi:hypothetical protein
LPTVEELSQSVPVENQKWKNLRQQIRIRKNLFSARLSNTDDKNTEDYGHRVELNGRQ